ARARAKGLEFEVSVDANLSFQPRGYPDHIRQVLALLLDNAIKFTENGAISLHAEPVPTVARAVKFAVTDTGCGISAERLAILRHPFSQIDSSLTRNAGGIGMGLTLAKQLVGLMGGSLEVHSKPGQGSTFSFTLPLVQENNAASVGSNEATPARRAA